jgi:para-nitrobenzyl esterase
MDVRQDEACLFLNVFTPAARINARAKLPVMVWIPGGGLISGESNDYDGAKLARNGVVLVTLNYRVEVLGFFAQTNIDREGHIFANYGMSVFAQMASPQAAGLFHKGIAESGAYVAVQNTTFTRSLSLPEAETIGRYFSLAAGCQELSPACLRKWPLQKVVQLQPDYQADFVVDGEVLPMPFGDAFQSGHINRVPVLNGTTLDEWRWFIALDERISGQPVTPD